MTELTGYLLARGGTKSKTAEALDKLKIDEKNFPNRFAWQPRMADGKPVTYTVPGTNDVKLIYESEPIAILGEGEVDKVRVHDLSENEEYELFVDAVVVLE